jgi:hypothetical protein
LERTFKSASLKRVALRSGIQAGARRYRVVDPKRLRVQQPCRTAHDIDDMNAARLGDHRRCVFPTAPVAAFWIIHCPGCTPNSSSAIITDSGIAASWQATSSLIASGTGMTVAARARKYSSGLDCGSCHALA